MLNPASDLANNPLLAHHALPPFESIKPAMIEPAIDALLTQNREQIERILARRDFSWTGLMQPLEVLSEALHEAWSPVSHLNAVANTPELREAYEACLPKLAAYSSWFGQHEGLFNAFTQLHESVEFSTLNTAQQKTIENTLRDFRLAGVALNASDKERFAAIEAELSNLSNRFANHVLDATQAWHYLTSDEQELKGLPESARSTLQANALQKNQSGYRLTLDAPSLIPVLNYAENRDLREKVYHAYVTRASDQGPQANAFDNSTLMAEIVALRQELAQLLGFENYAEYSLATKMASSNEVVIDFLKDLAQRSKPQALEEFIELAAYADQKLNISPLEPWDVSFASEQLRQERYDFSAESLRPYFPAPQVLQGLFKVVNRLYGLTIKSRQDVPKWHPDVLFFEIFDQGEKIAAFYCDLYAREGKRGGAWMDACRTRLRLPNGELQLPVAYLVCNFTAPVNDQAALFTHGEVITLFHEFGHGLHHMLTQQEVSDVSGINGVAWDAVEMPSQFMENFCWTKEGLALIAAHKDTGSALPDELFSRLLAAKNYHSAMQMMRQLEFALFDFRMHSELLKPTVSSIQALLDDVRREVSVVPISASNRFQHSFSHIFAGGYAAGYYSYKWAEVLSADAFAAFEEEGIFNQTVGQRFRENILEKGGMKDALALFIAFRGREPSVEPLLRHSGIAKSSTDAIAN